MVGWSQTNRSVDGGGFENPPSTVLMGQPLNTHRSFHFCHQMGHELENSRPGIGLVQDSPLLLGYLRRFLIDGGMVLKGKCKFLCVSADVQVAIAGELTS